MVFRQREFASKLYSISSELRGGFPELCGGGDGFVPTTEKNSYLFLLFNFSVLSYDVVDVVIYGVFFQVVV